MPTPESTGKDINQFIRRLRTRYKKLATELKYIIKKEFTKKGAVHYHLIINRLESSNADVMIKECWSKGRIDIKLLYDEGGYQKLAEYIVKKDKENSKGSSRYSRSRNLVTLKPKIKVLKRKTWKEPEAYKGYYVDKESIRQGQNPITGHNYQYFTMIKIKRRRSPCSKSQFT